MTLVKIPQSPIQCLNFINNEWQKSKGKPSEIISPYTGDTIGKIHHTTADEVSAAAQSAHTASSLWGITPIKERTQILFRFREILLERQDEISHCVSSECGKTIAEARAGLMKGIEVLEFALSLQNMDSGGRLEVSRGVFCEYRREPLGVVAGITPFNFPAMVPMWMFPIAIALGNSFIWKPSDKTPLTSIHIANAFKDSGLPSGVFTVLQGGRETVEAILDHPLIKAVGFVGSSTVAKKVYQRGTQNLKRVLALGGAKNHIFLMPDADPNLAAKNIVDSFTGCAGQRCMAASALLAVGDVDHLLQKIVETAKTYKIGNQVGAIISQDSVDRLNHAIESASKSGITLSLDGRSPEGVPESYKNGFWMGPTILDKLSPQSEAAQTELFGPVLGIIRCANLKEALEIENSNPYGNAASVFTQNGAVAEEVIQKAKAGMVGVNIGVPVPREPFSFGGFYESRFGQGDITGPGGVDFWTQLKKVTTKWTLQKDQNWMS